jgi:uncharacterized protein
MTGPERVEQEGVRGWLHGSQGASRGAVALTHGAGSNCEAALLVDVAAALAEASYAVLRFDLAFRQQRPTGPPAHSAARDQASIEVAAKYLRQRFPAVTLALAGHSYGGRQSTMLSALQPGLADALLLLSYPLHPPKQPEKLRTEHFPALHTPALFVQGARDEFGTIAEMQAALASVGGRTRLHAIAGVGHGLHVRHAREIAQAFATFTDE